MASENVAASGRSAGPKRSSPIRSAYVVRPRAYALLHVQWPKPNRPPRAGHRPPALRSLARSLRDRGLEHRGRRRLHARRLWQGVLRRVDGGFAGIALRGTRLPRARPPPRRRTRSLRYRRSSIPQVSVWLSLGVVLAVACVVVVALPFLRRPGLSESEDRLGEPDALERRRLELAEERDRALAALKELEFDHRTGKVSDEDYRSSVGPLRRRAAEALRALEPRSGTGTDAETG